MKKRIFKIMFIFVLLFGFTFSLASCNKNDNTSPEQADDKKDEPVTPVTPEPVTPDPVTPTPVVPTEPEGEPNILTNLPEGYYVDLFKKANNSIAISFKDCKVITDEGEKQILDDSFVNISFVDNKLKANGYLNVTNKYEAIEENVKTYFSLDDEFMCRQINLGSIDFSYKATLPIDEFSLPEDEAYNETYIYREISLTKEEIFNRINEFIQPKFPGFDINEINSIADFNEIFGIKNINIPVNKIVGDTILNIVMPFIFENSFAENEIKLSFTFKSLKAILLSLDFLKLKDIYGLIPGQSFDDLMLYFTDYTLVNKEDVPAPKQGVQYFTYNSSTKEYELASVTAWEDNIDYYIDNKDISDYTLAELLLVGDNDEEGFINVKTIDSLIDLLLPLVKDKIQNRLYSILGDQELDQKFMTSILIATFGFLTDITPKSNELLKPVTGLTAWDDDLTYYSSIYNEETGLTEFDPYEYYFTLAYFLGIKFGNKIK